MQYSVPGGIRKVILCPSAQNPRTPRFAFYLYGSAPPTIHAVSCASYRHNPGFM